MTQEIKVQVSSGNVFADLGLENSDELLIKAELARKISSIITKQHITQAEAAELLSINQWKIIGIFDCTAVSLFKCFGTRCGNCGESKTKVSFTSSNTGCCFVIQSLGHQS